MTTATVVISAITIPIMLVNKDHYEKANEELRFFKAGVVEKRTVTEFPVVKTLKAPSRVKVGRNAPCPCGSGKKYKKCCIRKK